MIGSGGRRDNGVMAKTTQAAALSDADIDAIESLLDALPAPLEPPDASALDGFLTGVALQRPAVAPSRWLPFVADVEGRSAPATPALARLHALAQRRWAELDAAIAQRCWFDPWIFELDGAASPSESVLGWVAGFGLAMDLFPGLMRADAAATIEPLAVIFSALDPNDLEDADELLATIETLEPPSTLSEAVEDLVRSTLLLADVSRPRAVTVRTAASRARGRRR